MSVPSPVPDLDEIVERVWDVQARAERDVPGKAAVRTIIEEAKEKWEDETINRLIDEDDELIESRTRAVAAERERCAKLIQDRGCDFCADDLAAAIRQGVSDG